MRLTARDELVISVIIDKADGPAGHSNDSQNGFANFFAFDDVIVI